LEKELLFLKQELTDLRMDLINKRCRKWDLDAPGSEADAQNT
jgi:hypothetical protein